MPRVRRSVESGGGRAASALRLRLAGFLGAATVGLLAITTCPAGAQPATQTQTVTVDYTCNASLNGNLIVSGQGAGYSIAVTTPQMALAGSPLTVTLAPYIPGQGSLGGPPLNLTATVTNMTVAVEGTGVLPAVQTAALVAPVTLNTTVGTSIPLAPLTFTASSSGGTASFSAGELTAAVTIDGGTFSGDTATLTCSPVSGNVALASVPIVSVSSVPAGSVGGATTAGTVGLVGGGLWLVRRRRSPGRAPTA